MSRGRTINEPAGLISAETLIAGISLLNCLAFCEVSVSVVILARFHYSLSIWSRHENATALILIINFYINEVSVHGSFFIFFLLIISFFCFLIGLFDCVLS